MCTHCKELFARLILSLVSLSLSQVFTRKLEEVGRVLFLISLTQKIPTAHKQSHVSMLQEDLLRLPSFPRSAIDAEFSLFSDPQGMAFWQLSLAAVQRLEGFREALHLFSKRAGFICHRNTQTCSVTAS